MAVTDSRANPNDVHTFLTEYVTALGFDEDLAYDLVTVVQIAASVAARSENVDNEEALCGLAKSQADSDESHDRQEALMNLARMVRNGDDRLPPPQPPQPNVARELRATGWYRPQLKLVT